MRPSEQAVRQLIATYGKDAPLIVADYLSAFPEGSRVLKDVEIYAGIWRPPPYGEEGQRMAGRKEVFLWIRTMLALTPADVEKLIGDMDDTGE
jgi:hypothetical protein